MRRERARIGRHERKLALLAALKDPHDAIAHIWRAAPWPESLRPELEKAAAAHGVKLADHVFVR